jgi:hypothetical protein
MAIATCSEFFGLYEVLKPSNPVTINVIDPQTPWPVSGFPILKKKKL